jgi:hypothetical protein
VTQRLLGRPQAPAAMVTKVACVSILLAASLLAGCTGTGGEQDRAREAEEPGAGETGADPVQALGGQDQGAHQPRADAAAGPSANGTAAPTSPQGPSLGSFQVVRQVASADVAPWYLAAVAIPEGEAGLAGFRWTVPQGAVREHEDFSSIEGVSLEVALVVPEGQAVDEYLVSIFLMDGETPELLGLLLGTTYEVRSKLTPALVAETQLRPPMDPFFLYFDADAVDEGDELGIVVSARGPATAFGLAWRVLEENVYFTDEEPSDDTEDFLEDASGSGPGLALQARGTGAGAQVAIYVDINLQEVVGVEATAGPVSVTDALPTAGLRPVASARDLTVASSYDNPHPETGGWGLAELVYLTAAGAAPWSVTGDVHGTPLDESGVAAGATLGVPAVAFAMGGEGPSSSVEAQLTVASTGYFEILLFLTLDYGTAVSTLLGSEPPARSLAGSTASAAFQGDDLVVTHPDAAFVVLRGVRDLA